MVWSGNRTRATSRRGLDERTRTLTTPTHREAVPRAANDDLPDEIVRAVIDVLEKDKAEALLVLDLEGKSTLADQMIIASGRSARHVSALADHVIRRIKELGGKRARVEGLPGADWVLIDTGDLMVHLFRPEVREFYNIERIWADTEAGAVSVSS